MGGEALQGLYYHGPEGAAICAGIIYGQKVCICLLNLSHAHADKMKLAEGWYIKAYRPRGSGAVFTQPFLGVDEGVGSEAFQAIMGNKMLSAL